MKNHVVTRTSVSVDDKAELSRDVSDATIHHFKDGI